MLSYFSRAEASSILGIGAGRLRYWQRIGLVSPAVREGGKSYYNFQDLICLRTAQGLVSRGMPATRIKKSIESLKDKFPGVDAHLASQRIEVVGNRAIISHKDQLMDSQSGQLVFRFEVEELARRVRHRIRSFESKKSADEWFQEGVRHDRSAETYPEALRAYREALKQDPLFVDAYVNMGNVYYAQKQFIEAQRCYRLALDQEPRHPKACFNLGNVMDELNCTEEAVYWYQKSQEADPEFPDVYYNLALTSEKLQLWDRALLYWKRYLTFDSNSEHARLARQRIKLLQYSLTRP